MAVRIFHGDIKDVPFEVQYDPAARRISFVVDGRELAGGMLPVDKIEDKTPPYPEALDDYDWEQAFELAGESVTRANPLDRTTPTDDFTREDVKEIIGLVEGEGDGNDWIGIFLLKDGRYAAVVGGVCMTGWDCEGSADSIVAYTLTDLLRYGVTDEQRRRLAAADEDFMNRVIARVAEGK